jgi:uncharacterized glyoxalase superfamily protein PhnB
VNLGGLGAVLQVFIEISLIVGMSTHQRKQLLEKWLEFCIRKRMKASAIIPALVYNDTPAAIAWLCQTFGFKKHLVVPGENGTVSHAELTMGEAMVMLGSASSGSDYAKMTRSPIDLGFQTQSPYLVVEDPDAVYASAKKNGARMVIDIKDEDYGGRGFSCADPEGYLWSFGSYDPWKKPSEHA